MYRSSYTKCFKVRSSRYFLCAKFICDSSLYNMLIARENLIYFYQLSQSKRTFWWVSSCGISHNQFVTIFHCRITANYFHYSKNFLPKLLFSRSCICRCDVSSGTICYLFQTLGKSSLYKNLKNPWRVDHYSWKIV